MITGIHILYYVISIIFIGIPVSSFCEYLFEESKYSPFRVKDIYRLKHLEDDFIYVVILFLYPIASIVVIGKIFLTLCKKTPKVIFNIFSFIFKKISHILPESLRVKIYVAWSNFVNFEIMSDKKAIS